MKDITNYYFFVDRIKYNKQDLINLYENTPKNWSYYGPRSKNTLWILPIDIETFLKTELSKSINLEYIDSVAFMLVKSRGRVSPHIDTRPTSFLFPILGNFENSVLNFYDEYLDKKTFELTNKEKSIAGSTVTYRVGEPSTSITYSRPIIINSHVIHSVNNYSNDDRVNFNITLKRNLSYNDVFELYEKNILII